jgi:hypothetical protein
VLATAYRLTWAGAAVIGVLALMPRASAEETDKAALAAALAKVPTTLEKGLQASEKTGKPISAKFEIEDGKLQLSIYTAAPAGFTEVIVAPDSGAVASSEKITDADDLKAATAQNAAMKKAAASLIAATARAVQQNAGSRAVSIFPELRGGDPVAAVTLLGNGQFTTVMQKLN